ncbi:MAG: hypothetical protein FWB91_04015 [Defluviitaleaceae bacterium]|nr:hypothetical protein [Defluviitaleaceae bacterium]
MENRSRDNGQRRAAGNIFKFLAIMLVLTLVVRGTSAATLASVSVAMPGRGVIIEDISGIATVFAAENINIEAPEGLTVLDMLVGLGQEVRVGDAIARFSMEELVEMHIRENTALERKRLDLEGLQQTNTVDSSVLDNAQRSLTRALEDYSAVVQRDEEDVAVARTTLDTLLLEGNTQATRTLLRALEDYETISAQGRADIADAQQALLEFLSSPPNEADDTSLQNAIRAHRRALDDFMSVREQGEADIAASQETLDELLARRPADFDRTALENAQRARNRARDDYNAARQRGQESIAAAQNALDHARWMLNLALQAYPPDQASVAAAMANLDTANAALNAAQNTRDTTLLQLSRALEDAETALAQSQRNFNESQQGELEHAEQALEDAQNRAANNLHQEARRLEDAEIALEQALRNFASAWENEVESLENALENAQTTAENNQRAAAHRLEDASYSAGGEIERAQEALVTAINRANNNRQTEARRVDDARNALTAAHQTHQNAQLQSNEDTVRGSLSAITLQLDINSQEKVVETLERIMYNNGVLYADKGGVVATVLPSGSEVGRTPLATLRNIEGGFEAQMEITRAEAEGLAVGSQSQVTTGGGSIFFTPTVTGEVSGISQPNENDRVTVTIRLPDGNWTSGQRVDAQVVLSSSSYDLTIPISALRSDNAGYFLYIVGRRATVLGLQNIVTRMNVNVVARDNETASVSGPVFQSNIIVASSRAISDGDRVRVNGG